MVTSEQIRELRDRTGAGLMACKKILEEHDGDIDASIDALRKRGELKASEKSGRSTEEGVVAIAGKTIVKLLCETDFVARNESFITFAQEIADMADDKGIDEGKAYYESVNTDKIQAIGENIVLREIVQVSNGAVTDGYIHSNNKIGSLVTLGGGSKEKAKEVAMHVVAMNPLCARADQISKIDIDKEKSIYAEQLKSEGKPADIIDKIIEGKVKKFCADQALESQPFVKDPSISVNQFIGNEGVIDFVRLSI